MVLLCRKAFKLLKDYAFRNSIRFLLNLVVWPILMIIYSALAFSFLPWEIALAAMILLIPAPIVAHEMWRMFRLEKSDWRLANNTKLKEIYKEINKLLFSKN